MNSVSIVGCGWLGQAVAKRLLATGISVRGSVTSEEKRQQMSSLGIDSYLLNLANSVNSDLSPVMTSPAPDSLFWQSESFLVSIPPRRNLQAQQEYPFLIAELVKKLVDFAPNLRQVVYWSSTAVYKSQNQAVDEEGHLEDSAANALALIQAERLIKDAFPEKYLILRLGGLYGPAREIGSFFRKNNDTPRKLAAQERANLVHQQDVVSIVELCLQKSATAQIYNVVSDEHPLKVDLYRRLAEKQGYPPPSFEIDLYKEGKIILNDKLKRDFSYIFEHEPG